MGITHRNPYFEDELQALIERKNQLDLRIHRLQQSREELTLQLDHLERSITPYRQANRSYSSPTTPIHHRYPRHCMPTFLHDPSLLVHFSTIRSSSCC